MKSRKNWIGIFIMLILMGLTGVLLLREQPFSVLSQVLGGLRPGWIVVGLGLMFLFVGCEALCSKLILRRMGYHLPYRRCMGYSFTGFYFSSITPSATGGQPAQVYYMSKDGVPAAHGALNMMLIAVCYQVVVLVYALVAALVRPESIAALGGGLGLLLLYGGVVNLFLTAGMLCLMFAPNAARIITGAVLRLMSRLHLVKDRAAAEEKLACQMAEYRRGAECLRHNPSLIPTLLGLTFLQLTALFAVPCAVYLAFGLTGHTPLELIGTQALVTLAVASLPLPGAVGASEGGFVQAFALFFGAGLVTPAVLVSRGISFYAFLLISAVVTLIVHLHSRDPKPKKIFLRAHGPSTGAQASIAGPLSFYSKVGNP